MIYHIKYVSNYIYLVYLADTNADDPQSRRQNPNMVAKGVHTSHLTQLLYDF